MLPLPNHRMTLTGLGRRVAPGHAPTRLAPQLMRERQVSFAGHILNT